MPDGRESTSTPPPVAAVPRKGPYRTIGTDRVKWGATAVTIALIILAVVTGKVLVFWIIFGLAWLLMTWRAWILGVYVEQDGVKIVQYVTTKRVAWEDIDHFAVLPAGNYPFAGQIVIRGRSRPLVIAGMGAAARPNPDAKRLQVQKPIDELNAILAEWRNHAGYTADGGSRQ